MLFKKNLKLKKTSNQIAYKAHIKNKTIYINPFKTIQLSNQ